MKLATWNVNSIRARVGLVQNWLARIQPDLLLLQEIKCESASFPADSFADLGYRSVAVGQKSYNGVAILSRLDLEVRCTALPDLDEAEPQARYLEVAAGGLVIGNLYLPNGNSGGEDGYAAKLRWLAALAARAAFLLHEGQPFLLAGDYNICPAEIDLAPGALGTDDALVRPESRAGFRRLLWLGLSDAVRTLHPDQRLYSFWDYQAGAWRADRGLRIDHVLLCPELAQCLQSALPDRAERGEPQPSDHVPVVVELGALPEPA